MSLEKNMEITYEEFLARKKEPEIKHYRLLAKVANLGFPGGLGIKKLIENAKATYGVDISLEQGEWLREMFFEEYKDLRTFMRVYSKQWETGHRILIPDEDDKVRKIQEYWYLVGDRVRRGCSYNAWANGFLMQSLAADGGKIAAYEVCKYLEKTQVGYLQGFIHDELLFSLKRSPTLQEEVEEIAYMMCSAMRRVTPDVRITVEASVMGPKWSKNGPFEFENTFWINKDNTRGKF